jgi:processive 1,2-diacylglycerol beta-glucosyltransferase
LREKHFCHYAITKAGGLIVSEVLARGTPLLLVDPIPGQEEWNADYVVIVGAGVQLRMVELVPMATKLLLSQPERLALQRRYAEAAGRPGAAVEIAGTILRELSKAPTASVPASD